MLRNKMLSVLSAGLLFASAAGATERTFEFTGTVSYTSNAGLAPVGSKVMARFNYDDAMTGDYIQDWYAFYGLTTFVSGTVNGHTVISDRTNVTVNDTVDAQDLVDVNGVGGIMVDGSFYQDGVFGFRLLGDSNANTSRSLPSSYDLSRFNMEKYGYVMLGNDNYLVQFSIDSIVNVDPTCLKNNGKPGKHCDK